MQRRRVVYLHVGGHKTGTTFLQNVLWRNRDALKSDGLLYPGSRQASHVWANLDLRKAEFKGHRSPQVEGAWRRLVDEIEAWDGPAIIDHEMFSLAAPQHITRALDDLSFAEVHVVFTARDMARQLPAAWQEWIKNGDTLTFKDFLCAVREDSEHARRLRSMHDVPAILEKWSNGLPPGQVHVVTVPPPGADRGMLWRRFAQVLGIDPDRYRTDVHTTNASLGAAEVTVIRRLNEQLGEVPWPRYGNVVKGRLAGVLARRRGARIELPQDAFEWAVEQGHRIVDALTAAGYDVVGDLAELLPAQRPTGVNPDDAPAEDQAAAAIAGLAAAIEGFDKRTQTELRRLRSRLEEAERKLAESEQLSQSEPTEPADDGPAREVGSMQALRRRFRTPRRR